MVSLTSLLVLASLLTQTSESLPKTSYFKMVDIWLFSCILTIFLIILFHTATNATISHCNLKKLSLLSMASNETFKNCQLLSSVITPDFILKAGKILLPSGLAIFNLIYWWFAYGS